MKPFWAGPMRMWPISTRVNKPENDDPSSRGELIRVLDQALALAEELLEVRQVVIAPLKKPGEQPPAPRTNNGLAARRHIWGATPCIEARASPRARPNPRKPNASIPLG